MSLTPLPWDCIFYMMEWLEPDDLMDFPHDYIHAYCNDVATPLRQYEISLYCDYIVAPPDYTMFMLDKKWPETVVWKYMSIAAKESRMDVFWVILKYYVFIISYHNKKHVWIRLAGIASMLTVEATMIAKFLKGKQVRNYRVFVDNPMRCPRMMIRLVRD